MRGLVFLLLMIMPAVSFAKTFHTPPEEWEEPRVYHTEINEEEDFEERLEITHIHTQNINIDKEEKFFSPNQVYWYFVEEHENKILCRTKFCPINIYVFNERDYLINIKVKEAYKSSAVAINWVNEKLLYVEFWWNNKDGVYFLFDIEKEAIIAKEAVHSGFSLFKELHD